MADSEYAAFQRSASFYRHLFDATPDVLLMIDYEGMFQLGNLRFADVLGYTPEAMHRRSIREILSPDDQSDFEVFLRGVKEGTPMPETEVQVRSRQDRFIPMMLDVRPLESDETPFLLVRLRDLREIKALEQEYRNLFESIADAVFIGNTESGQMYRSNRQACELTGYSQGELMGQDYDRVHTEPWEVILEEIRATGGVELSGREAFLKTKDGEEIPVEMHVRIVPRGEDWIYIESAIDISERKALEARMRELRSEWESFIRHELRTPLTPILAFSQILIEDYPEVRENPKFLRYLEAIWQGGRRLEQLLDLTREIQNYEQGKVSLQLFAYNLYDTLKEAIQEATMGAGEGDPDGQARVRLIAHEGTADAAELPLIHDAEKLKRALANLVKNALEHDPGEVTVRVQDRPEEHAVVISVHNWGAPIPEDRLKTIFEKYNTTKRDNKGTGLGTTIAKLFVEAHNGQIEAASSEAEGTTFTVWVPKASVQDILKSQGL